MTDKERIAVVREGWSESIAALEYCRIFLEGLKGQQWNFWMHGQIEDLLERVDHAAEIAERDFKPELIN